MSWEIIRHESAGIVEARLTGVVTGDALREATTEGIRVATKHRLTRGLIDAAEQVRSGSMVDMVELPQQYSDQGLSREMRIAVVMPTAENLHGTAEFYETVCVNRGWQVQTFPARDEAIGWLLAGPDKR